MSDDDLQAIASDSFAPLLAERAFEVFDTCADAAAPSGDRTIAKALHWVVHAVKRSKWSAIRLRYRRTLAASEGDENFIGSP